MRRTKLRNIMFSPTTIGRLEPARWIVLPASRQQGKLLASSLPVVRFCMSSAAMSPQCQWHHPDGRQPSRRGTLVLVSSFDPRLTPVPAAAHPELTAADFASLKSTVPHSTHILVGGVMLLFFTTATLITLQAGLLWWLVPVAFAVPVVVVLAQRTARVNRSRASHLAVAAALREAAGRPGAGQ